MGLSAQRAVRRRAAVDAARAETAKTLSSGPSAVDANNLVWLDFINPDPTIEEAKTKARLWGRAFTVSGYDQSPIDNPTAIAE
jgi:hypothetical protein